MSTATSMSMLPFTRRRPDESVNSLGRLGHQGIAVVRQPVGQRLQRRVFVGLQHCRVIIGANDMRFFTEELEQVAVIHIKAEVCARAE